MNRTLAIFTLSVLLTTCGQEAAEPTESRPIAVATSSPVADVNESERLTQWLDARNEELLTMSPMLMTSLGRKDRYDEIDDVSEAAWVPIDDVLSRKISCSEHVDDVIRMATSSQL